MNDSGEINDFKIKFSIIDYFSNKNISSRELNGQKKVWDLDTVLKCFHQKQLILKVRAYKNRVSKNNHSRKLLFIIEDGMYHTKECSDHEFERWFKNLTLADTEILRENIINSKDNVNLNNKVKLKTKNKVKFGL